MSDSKEPLVLLNSIYVRGIMDLIRGNSNEVVEATSLRHFLEISPIRKPELEPRKEEAPKQIPHFDFDVDFHLSLALI